MWCTHKGYSRAMQERAENTRQAVLEGAAASFEKFGYGTASLSTIMAHAGVSKGAMYFHFSSKEDLARAVMDAHFRMAMASLHEIERQSFTALDTVVLASMELARQLISEPIARGGMRLTLEFGRAHGPSERPFREWIAAMSELLAQAKSAGDVLDTLDNDALAHYIVGCFTGVHTMSEILTGRDDLIDRMREMWHIMLPGIVPPDRLARTLAVASEPVRNWLQESAPATARPPSPSSSLP